MWKHSVNTCISKEILTAAAEATQSASTKSFIFVVLETQKNVLIQIFRAMNAFAKIVILYILSDFISLGWEIKPVY